MIFKVQEEGEGRREDRFFGKDNEAHAARGAQKARKKRFERGKELRARRRRSSLPRSKRFLRNEAHAARGTRITRIVMYFSPVTRTIFDEES